MSDKLNEDIEIYYGYFMRKIEEINTLQSPGHKLFKRVLYVSVLDTLSRAAYPNDKNNRNRFTSFVVNYCDWSNGNKISLLHLVQALKLSTDSSLNDARRYAVERFSKTDFRFGAIPDISVDPNIEEILTVWPKDIDVIITSVIKLEYLKHFNLVYAFRNSLVHEFRFPGHGMDISDNTEAFYHYILAPEGDDFVTDSIELVYPFGFCRRICISGLNNLKNHLIGKSINPYDLYDFGTYWIKGLNEE